jgi:ferrous iron transport protein B
MKKLPPLFNNTFVKAIFFFPASWAVFYCIFFLGTHPAHLIDFFFQWLFRLTWHNVFTIWLRDFLVFGLLTGLGGFLVYVPNIVLLFFFSNIACDTGLSIKAARFVNPFFRLFGLNGNSFSSLVFGFGCSVNALQSAQSIENRKNRLLTMLVAPFMSCGSKFAVYVLLISVLFKPNEAPAILIGLYLIGISFALCSAFVFRRFLKIKPEDTFEEIPDEPLRKPHIVKLLSKTLNDGWIFCYKAGSVIVIASVVIWALSYLPGVSQEKYDQLVIKSNEMQQQLPSRLTLSFHNSYAAQFGQFIEPIFAPMGQNWKNSIAIVCSLAGRGAIISTLIIIYGIDLTPEGKNTLVYALQADPTFSKLSAATMMLFILLCGSCLASITMFYNHTKSKWLTVLFVIYPIVVGWVVSVVFYQGMKSFVV